MVLHIPGIQPPPNALKRTRWPSKAARSIAPTVATHQTTLFSAQCPSQQQLLQVLQTTQPAANVLLTETTDSVTKYWALQSIKTPHKPWSLYYKNHFVILWTETTGPRMLTSVAQAWQKNGKTRLPNATTLRIGHMQTLIKRPPTAYKLQFLIVSQIYLLLWLTI